MYAPPTPSTLTVVCPVCDGEVSRFYVRPHVASHSRRELMRALWLHSSIRTRIMVTLAVGTVAASATTATLMILERTGTLPW
jgi:hypothetical protein